MKKLRGRSFVVFVNQRKAAPFPLAFDSKSPQTVVTTTTDYGEARREAKKASEIYKKKSCVILPPQKVTGASYGTVMICYDEKGKKWKAPKRQSNVELYKSIRRSR